MRHLKAFFAIVVAFTVIDLIWLGVVAEKLYSEALGPLRAKEVVWVAAGLFYVQYVLVIQYFAVMPSQTMKQAAKRGFLIGWIGYVTYELTNWAVIENWPAELVLIDIAWGLFLTTSIACAGWWAAGPPPEQVVSK